MPTALRNARGLALQDLDAAAVYRAIYDLGDMRHFSGGVANDAVRQSIHAIVEPERLLTIKGFGEREDEFMMLKCSCMRGTPR
ncbi:MAG: hypothetical protein ABIO88_10115 [Burkholderiaceae bacterium]